MRNTTSFSTSNLFIYLYDEGGHHMKTIGKSQIVGCSDWGKAVEMLVSFGVEDALAENIASEFHFRTKEEMVNFWQNLNKQ